MGHGHHHHSHAAGHYGRAFPIGIALNTLFVIFEILFGLRANSLALLADAGHNAGDVAGLVMAWGAVWLSRRTPTQRYTYGLQSSSIIAALANATLLLTITGGLMWEALQRLYHPEATGSAVVMAVAAAGILVNGLTALLFMKGRGNDLNIRAAFLHMAADTAISLGVVICGLIMLATGWLWLDPLASMAIGGVIIAGTWDVLKESANLALHGVPPHIDHAGVKTFLSSLDRVKEIHDLHIWAMSTTETALSAHLLMPGGHPGDRFVHRAMHVLEERFHIGHSTLQIELGDDMACELAPDHIV